MTHGKNNIKDDQEAITFECKRIIISVRNWLAACIVVMLYRFFTLFFIWTSQIEMYVTLHFYADSSIIYQQFCLYFG